MTFCLQDQIQLEFLWQGSNRLLTSATFPELAAPPEKCLVLAVPTLWHHRGCAVLRKRRWFSMGSSPGPLKFRSPHCGCM